MEKESYNQGTKEAALYYASMGWRVLPLHSVTDDGYCTCSKGRDCQSPGKHPIIKSGPGHAAATTDEATIRKWWQEHWWANVGIATGPESNLTVLDVDPRNGGEESLEELIREYGPLPEGPVVLTGGGGTHYYFSYPHGRSILTAKLGPGLDTLGDGKLVVAPPSRHA